MIYFYCRKGLQFETSAMFRRHVQETCQHESRVPVIVCRICHLRSSRSQKQNENARELSCKTIQVEDNNAKQDSIEKSKPPSNSLIDSRSLMSHLYQNHVTLIYRCTACPRAFVRKDAIYEHRIREHNDSSENTGENINGKMNNFIVSNLD